MIKMIAIDLDGTLYNSSRLVTPRSREAVARALANGVQPVIVTGRGRPGAEMALDLLGMDLPYICSAGALVRSGRGGQTLHAWTFHEPAEFRHVIEFTRRHGSGLIGEPRDGVPYWFGPDSMQEIMDPLTAAESMRSIRTFQPEVDFDRPLLKATITADPPTLAEALDFITRECPSIDHVISGIQYVDLTASGVNKGRALGALAQARGLPAEQVAAIGDQYIDLQMLRFAGLPVAMRNAVPVLKEAARWIAPSNDEDGVAWAIDEILRGNGTNVSGLQP